MPRRKMVWLLTLLAALVVGAILFFAVRDRAKPLAMDSPEATEMQAVIEAMYQAEHAIRCHPGTPLERLDAVLADSADYRPSTHEREAVTRAYGREALPGAGFLTARKALHFLRDHPLPATPVPGLRPTAAPVRYCPDDPPEIKVRMAAISLYGDARAVVHYESIGCSHRATLRYSDGAWKITELDGWCGA